VSIVVILSLSPSIALLRSIALKNADTKHKVEKNIGNGRKRQLDTASNVEKRCF